MAAVEEKKEAVKIVLSEANEENTRKIPKALFIVSFPDSQDNVEDFVKKHGGDHVQRQLAQLYSQYKLMEANMNRQKIGLKTKLPDIQKTLEAVNMLIAKHESDSKSFQTQYLLSDNIWGSVEVPNQSGTVMLWLGANTMVEFPFQDAKQLLENNLKNGRDNVQNLEKDLDFLKTQITTMQVNLARVHNEITRVKRLEGGKS